MENYEKQNDFEIKSSKKVKNSSRNGMAPRAGVASSFTAFETWKNEISLPPVETKEPS